MRPKVKFLEDNLIEKIINEAYSILEKIGIEVYNSNVISLLLDYGCKEKKYNGKKRILISQEIVEKALSTVPSSFKIYDVLGNEVFEYRGDNVCFVPGSTALKVLDRHTGEIRRAVEDDCIEYFKIIEQLKDIKVSSTSITPSDIDQKYVDTYRLYLSLLYSEKSIVSGCFTIESFEAMKNMQVIVRGSEEELKKKSLCIFSVCPSSPLKFSTVTSQNLLDCGRYSIPIEIITMPIMGLISPVTLIGSVVQHTIETLSVLVIGQLANPGMSMLYGCSSSSFDMRYGSINFNTIEANLVGITCSEVGKYLHCPTQCYISFGDSKFVDYQASLETTMGGVLAALSSVNSISGPGMLYQESTYSLQKLILDNELVAMIYRMLCGIELKEEFSYISLFEELLSEGNLLSSMHTIKYLKKEHYIPNRVIDRMGLEQWRNDGSKDILKRTNEEIDKLLKLYIPTRLSEDKQMEISKIMDFYRRSQKTPPFMGGDE